jgi:hypothetical protein
LRQIQIFRFCHKDVPFIPHTLHKRSPKLHVSVSRPISSVTMAQSIAAVGKPPFISSVPRPIFCTKTSVKNKKSFVARERHTGKGRLTFSSAAKFSPHAFYCSLHNADYVKKIFIILNFIIFCCARMDYML